MIYRVVRLHLRPEETARFEAFFRERQPQIEAFDGCYKTILLRNTKEPDVYYTLSEWESEAHLDRYRYSAFQRNLGLHQEPLRRKSPGLQRPARRDVE